MSTANERQIWDYLLERIGNPYGVAGLMGNLYAESGLNPGNLQNSYEKSLNMTDEQYTRAVDDGSYANFASDAAGYGLAQWTFSTRKAGLLALAKERGQSVGDLQLQLDYLWQELQGYKAVLSVLKNAATVRQASDEVLTKYERPADQSENMRVIRMGYGMRYYELYAPPADGCVMTAKDLCARLKDIALNYKTIYMYAAYGFKVNDRNIAIKAKQNLNKWYSTPGNIEKLRAVANRTPTWWGFDCVNLLKGVLWGWTGDESQEYGGAKIRANGVPDTNANGMIKKCYAVSDDFTDIQPGEGLWIEGHWGTYVGDGLAVECTGAWKNGVQVTAVWNIGKKTGYKGRKWSLHGKLPWIDYQVTAQAPAEEPAKQTASPTAPADPSKVLFAYGGLLKRGAKGENVRSLQSALNRLGYVCGAADGIFGPKTEAAVRQLQAVAGIGVDGEFGPISYAALKRIWQGIQ